jgi:hypothetical protein
MAVDKLILQLDATGKACIYFNGMLLAQGQLDLSLQAATLPGTKFQIKTGGDSNTTTPRTYRVVESDGQIKQLSPKHPEYITATVEYAR